MTFVTLIVFVAQKKGGTQVPPSFMMVSSEFITCYL
jgi:hypothetical protein